MTFNKGDTVRIIARDPDDGGWIDGQMDRLIQREGKITNIQENSSGISIGPNRYLVEIPGEKSWYYSPISLELVCRAPVPVAKPKPVLDFTKPLRTRGLKFPVRVLTMNRKGYMASPVMALVDNGSIESVYNFTLAGRGGGFQLENVPEESEVIVYLKKKYTGESVSTLTKPSSSERILGSAKVTVREGEFATEVPF